MLPHLVVLAPPSSTHPPYSVTLIPYYLTAPRAASALKSNVFRHSTIRTSAAPTSALLEHAKNLIVCYVVYSTSEASSFDFSIAQTMPQSYSAYHDPRRSWTSQGNHKRSCEYLRRAVPTFPNFAHIDLSLAGLGPTSSNRLWRGGGDIQSGNHARHLRVRILCAGQKCVDLGSRSGQSRFLPSK